VFDAPEPMSELAGDGPVDAAAEADAASGFL